MGWIALWIILGVVIGAAGVYCGLGWFFHRNWPG